MLDNLYQQNTNIIKGFFRKPIVLVNVIVMFATIVVNLVMSVFISNSVALKQLVSDFLRSSGFEHSVYPNSYSFNTSIPVMSILIAVAFLLFYIFSRNPQRTLNGPATMFQVLSIIQLVTVCLLSALCVLLMFFFTILMFAPEGQFLAIFVLILAVLVVAILIEAISRFMFANSIKKSLNGIYLFRNGAKTFAVMQFISVAFSALSAIAFMILGSVASSQFNYYYTTDPMFCYLFAISFAIGTLPSLFMGILAVQYDSYIKDMTQNFSPVQQAPIFQPVYQNPEPTPAPYEPQQYTQPEVQADEPQGVFCSNCGKQLNPDDYFCNQCGTPVKK
ncbi:MAG: zinc ribbon domain-containing protein [Ruminococcus sp.]|nr:zinc ribbon domain-containing protein [Ruminococcus sp.]